MKILIIICGVLLSFSFTELTAQTLRDSAYTFLKQSKFQEAINSFDVLITQDDKNPQFFYARGFAKYNLEKNDIALSDLNQAIALKEDYLEALLMRGNIFYLLKEYKKSVSDLGKAISIDSNNVSALLMRGQIECVLLKDNTLGCIDLKRAASLGSNAAKSLLTDFCSGSESKEVELFALDLPIEEHWELQSRQETTEIMVIDFVRKGETLENWSELINMTQVKGISVSKGLELKNTMSMLIDQAKKNAEDSKSEFIAEGKLDGRNYIMFTVESPRHTNDPNPESQLWFVIQGNTDLYMCFRAVKKATLTEEQKQNWSAFFRHSKFEH